MMLKSFVVAALLLLPLASARAEQEPAKTTPPAAQPAGDVPAAPTPPPAPTIEGKYRFVGGDKETKAVEEAIEKVVQEMLFIKRPIARGRLKDRNKVTSSWTFTTAGGQIKSAAEGIMTWSSPENGSSADVKTSTGDDAKLSQKIAGNKLTQVFTTKEGKRESIFTLGADGQTLTMDIVLVSEQLPIPLKYSLTYKK